MFIYPTKTANATDAARALLRYCATVGPVREVRSDPGSLNTFPRKSRGNYDAMTLQYGTLDEDLTYVMDFDKAPAYTKFVSDLTQNQSIIREAANKLRQERNEELDNAVPNYTLHQQGDLVLARASSKLNKRLHQSNSSLNHGADLFDLVVSCMTTPMSNY